MGGMRARTSVLYRSLWRRLLIVPESCWPPHPRWTSPGTATYSVLIAKAVGGFLTPTGRLGQRCLPVCFFPHVALAVQL